MTKPSEEEATTAKRPEEEPTLAKETLADLEATSDPTEEVKGGKPGCYGGGTGTSHCI